MNETELPTAVLQATPVRSSRAAGAVRGLAGAEPADNPYPFPPQAGPHRALHVAWRKGHLRGQVERNAVDAMVLVTDLAKPDGVSVGASIQEKFEAFHEANPWVFSALVGMTRELVSRGRRRVGMKMLFEVLRWQYYRDTDDPSSDFKLNNNYHSRYARLIGQTYPELAGVFELREMKSL